MDESKNIDDTPLLDKESALHHLEEEEDFLQELYAIFLEEIPVRIEKLTKAIDLGSFAEFASNAHSLKGVCMTIGAHSCREAALELEMSAKREELDAARENFARLQNILIEIRKELSS